ncbi:MAG: hypothetical protein HY695_18200 [Deltaproteobacteria bacterium]|nr:hypothetical protein [Deltaproteobacteria bacterium]
MQLGRSIPFLILFFALHPYLLYFSPLLSGSSDLLEIDALAPVEIVAEGFREPMGVVVDASDAVFVSDRKAGEVLRIVGNEVFPALKGLNNPVGLAFDPQGRLLIAEEGSGKLLRLEANGSLTVIADGFDRPRWVTVADDGTVVVSAKGFKSGQKSANDGEDDEGGQVILRISGAGDIGIFAGDFKGLQGISFHKSILYAAAKGLKKIPDSQTKGGVFQIPIMADGQAGPITWFTQEDLKRPIGLVHDSLGALFASAAEMEDERKAKNTIVKIRPDGTVGRFASELREPQGISLDSAGNLYVVEKKAGEHGRLLRFRAPPSPEIIFSRFTNQNPLTLTGTAQSQSRIDLFLQDSKTPITLTTPDGSFSLDIALLANSENSLHVFSTAENGLGLTTAPAELTIVHDNVAPVIFNLQPLNGSYLNADRPLIQANFSDNLSGVDVSRAKILLDGIDVTAQAAVTQSGFSFDPISFQFFPLSEGFRAVSVMIFDRAGNSAAALTNFTVDVTPPETQIVSGPEGTTSATSANFTVSGTDNLIPSGNLEFAWRLDGAPFSAFSPQTQISFSALTPGPHSFEIKARDLAGNEDPKPALRTFTVSLLSVRITEPAEGATVPSGPLLVRGNVEAGGAEVGVLVNGFPAAVQGNNFVALVPVILDITSLTATATTQNGTSVTQSTSISVTEEMTSSALLYASPTSGLAPLTVDFSLFSNWVPVQVDLDADGDGIIDFSGATLESLPFTFVQSGVYVATARVTDSEGNQSTATTLIQVYEASALDSVLQAKWLGMKDALRVGDINTGLVSIALSARDDYRELFTALTPQLGNIDQILLDISLVSVNDRRAEYEMIRVEDGLRLSYFVLFVVDDDGIWRVKFF